MDSESAAALADGVKDQYFSLPSDGPSARAMPHKQPFVIGDRVGPVLILGFG